MKTKNIPNALCEMFLWDKVKCEHFFLSPLKQPIGPPLEASRLTLARYRVEIRPEAYAVLIPQ